MMLKSLYKHMTPWGVASLEPRGLTGRIYVGDHLTLLHINVGLMVSEKKIFLSFSNYKSMGVIDPSRHGQFGPQGLDWQDLCRGPLNNATY